jgi:phosphopantothenoylcysteine decarboxylase/phosphopantothenate--cysteine ligase
VPVLRAADMRDAILTQCDDADVLVMAAAVADYQPAKVAAQKIRRKKQGLVVEMVPTPDILAEVGKANRLVKVGFAAESEELSANARRKLQAKGLQLIAANDVKDPQAGFGSDMNKVVLLDRDGGLEELQLLSKYEVAQRILDRVVPLLKR